MAILLDIVTVLVLTVLNCDRLLHLQANKTHMHQYKPTKHIYISTSHEEHQRNTSIGDTSTHNYYIQTNHKKTFYIILIIYNLRCENSLLYVTALRGTRYRSWLRHYATSWKVAGSSPSSLTMVLRSTRPLTEMSARNHPGGKKRRARRANTFAAICEPNV
jgi:hypothetical protein